MAAPDPTTRSLAILWRRGSWLCEYAKSSGVPGSLRLLREGTLALERRVRDLDDMLLVARTWKQLIEDELIPDGNAPETPAPDRRQPPGERRRIPRGGRRGNDPHG